MDWQIVIIFSLQIPSLIECLKNLETSKREKMSIMLNLPQMSLEKGAEQKANEILST